MSGEENSFRWWLGLQLGLALGGGAVWFGGAVMEEDFVSGVGVGLILAALLLRFGRTSTADDPGGR